MSPEYERKALNGTNLPVIDCWWNGDVMHVQMVIYILIQICRSQQHSDSTTSSDETSGCVNGLNTADAS